MTNPYQPPATDGLPPASPAGVDLVALRRIATYQRFIILAILAQIVGAIAFASMPPALQLLGRIIFVLIGIGSAVASVLLANALYGVVVAVFCTLLMFIPLVNLLTLLVLSQGATSRVRKAGYKVGFLGAKPDDIR
jgi:hypothetical protein